MAAIAEASARRARPAGAAGLAASPDAGGEAILKRSYPRDRQRIFGEAVAAAVGFDFRAGRLDVTAHPFCTGIGPGDCRITTRFDEHEFSDAFFGILHEVGHGLYEQGLDEAHTARRWARRSRWGCTSRSRGSGKTPWGAAGRSGPTGCPMARRIFHEALADVTLDAFHAAVNHVAPSLIRVQADEATYNLHIIVRFELEQALLAGDLAVADVPAAWNQKYREALGVTPANDAEGCLQDIHWSAGLIGYFPTYTLGNLYRGPALRRGPGRARRPRRRLRPRRFRRPARLAPREDSSPGSALSRPPTWSSTRHRLKTRPPSPDRRPAAEVWRAVRDLNKA